MSSEPFVPTHEVPRTGLPTWSAPDPSRPADNRLDAGVPVLVLEEATGWARIRCQNGWGSWVDASALVAITPIVFAPTHRVASRGLETRARPDISQPPGHRLEPGVPVAIVDSWGDWAKARCDNDWEAWVDARGLVRVFSSGASPLALWLPIAGAAIAVLGGLLPWFSGGGVDASAWDVELVGLFTHDDSDLDLKTGPVLLVTVLAALPLITRRPLPRWASAALAGVATSLGLLGFVLYFDLPEPRPDLGIGLFLTVLGGLVMAVGAFMAPRGAPRAAPAQ